MKTATINADELRAEVERLNLQKTHPKGFTSREFSEAVGCHLETAQRRLSALVREGHVKFIGHRPTTRIDGRANSIPVYALLKKKP